jgi:hypothetical protein
MALPGSRQPTADGLDTFGAVRVVSSVQATAEELGPINIGGYELGKGSLEASSQYETRLGWARCQRRRMSAATADKSRKGAVS